MPPKPKKGAKIRWTGGGSRVDEELDAVDYADNWEEEYDSKVVKVKEPEAPSGGPSGAPKETKETPAKPKAYQPPVAKQAEVIESAEEAESVLTTYDDWETAMDALDKSMTREEEERAKQRQTK